MLAACGTKQSTQQNTNSSTNDYNGPEVSADTRTDGDKQRIAVPLCRAEGCFTFCGGVGIVVNIYLLNARKLRKPCGNGAIQERQSCGIYYNAAFAVRTAG